MPTSAFIASRRVAGLTPSRPALHALAGFDERCLDAGRDAGLAPFKSYKPENDQAQCRDRKKLDRPSRPRRIFTLSRAERLLLERCHHRRRLAARKSMSPRFQAKFSQRRLGAILANDPMAHRQYAVASSAAGTAACQMSLELKGCSPQHLLVQDLRQGRKRRSRHAEIAQKEQVMAKDWPDHHLLAPETMFRQPGVEHRFERNHRKPHFNRAGRQTPTCKRRGRDRAISAISAAPPLQATSASRTGASRAVPRATIVKNPAIWLQGHLSPRAGLPIHQPLP